MQEKCALSLLRHKGLATELLLDSLKKERKLLSFAQERRTTLTKLSRHSNRQLLNVLLMVLYAMSVIKLNELS